MQILIIGAAGMVGRKLTSHLVAKGHLGDRTISRLTLHDVIDPGLVAEASFTVDTFASDFSDPNGADKLLADRPDVIFHLAAIVSGEAEDDFDQGYRVNLTGTWNLFEKIRALNVQSGGAYRPRIVFTSSTGVFGAPYEFIPAPLTSYGTQKAIGELLLADYTRKRFFDGIGIRLPTISVRYP